MWLLKEKNKRDKKEIEPKNRQITKNGYKN